MNEDFTIAECEPTEEYIVEGSPAPTTGCSAQGDFELLDRNTYRPIKHGTPDMGAMIQVMNELNRFYRTP